MKPIIIFIALCCTAIACTPKPKKSAQAKTYHFQYVQPPMPGSEEQAIAFMREHFWDKFDFADSLYTTKADTLEMIKAYAAFVSNFVGATNQEPIRKLMQQASVSKPMFEYFVMLSEHILHDPNSPLRSDELYIAVLEAQLASPHYDEYEKMAPKYNLQIVSQNRIGQKANNFRYTTHSGRTYDMYSLRSDFVIIYINNPGCVMCQDICDAMNLSPIISELQQQGRLKVLSIYTDENLDEWHKYRSEIPTAWINGYDKGCHIERQNLYNLNAIPALYLLDKNKIVLIKDSTDVAEIERYLLDIQRDQLIVN